jgi:eukaryotic-like serine/threonine-protein kinase
VTLSPGARLGPYQVLSAIGAGGMGEIYRALDPRLGREVAIKVLPDDATADVERLQRFEQEARAVGSLNHPNLLAVFDTGQHDGTPFVVFELLEGETLRSRFAKPLTLPKALDYATQIARGLAAAHERGIVHRDLKPENLFLTRDGRIKILDFGLAKLRPPLDASEMGVESPTASVLTDANSVLGTAGYMSPEQVRRSPSDHRSDIFSFGAVLYEMLSGRRAFQGETQAERMTAILNADPPPITRNGDARSPALERLVRHCLEKRPDDRFQSALDLVFDLESVAANGSAPSSTAVRIRPRLRPILLGALLGSALAAAIAYAKWPPVAQPPSFQQVTFRRQIVAEARFAPDGQTIIYGAAGDGRHNRIFSARLRSPEVQALDLPEGDIAAVSASGEMAIVLDKSYRGRGPGTLARVALAGGAPRELLEHVSAADWSPDGRELAVVRLDGPKARLEFPIGRVLYTSDTLISSIRVSPKGDRVAFSEAVRGGGDLIRVVDRSGSASTLATTSGVLGVPWSPSGDEVWYSEWGVVRAVSLAGEQRVLTRVAGPITLNDVSPDGRALVTMAQWHESLVVGGPGGAKERDLAWFERAQLAALSKDGNTVLFSDRGQVDGRPTQLYTYLRRTDGSAAVRLGEGSALSLSPDGKWAASVLPGPPTQLQLLPTGPGEPRLLTGSPLECGFASWFPDGERLLVACSELKRPLRLHVQDLEGKVRREITAENVTHFFLEVSPDGKLLFGADREDRPLIVPVDGGPASPVPGTGSHEVAAGWGSDSRSVFVYSYSDDLPVKIDEVDLRSGRRKRYKEITPPDLQAFAGIGRVLVAPGGTAYAYQYGQYLCILYVIEGLQ